MNSKDILYSKGKNDELYTPRETVLPILEFIKKDWTVWCPFDTKDSHFVKEIKKANKVLYSHINDGKDFFSYEPYEHWDCMISNPPFSGKRKIFERSLSFNKPIALLMTNTWLNDKFSKWVFYEADRNMELLMFDKRTHFTKPNGKIEKKTTFSSSYFCSDFLPKDIVLKKL
mgnify:CR=1 FL=1